MRQQYLLAMPLLLAAACARLAAQEPQHFEFAVDGPGVTMAPQTATVKFMAYAPGPDGKLVQGAPFQAEGVTEFNQSLADGTKISRTSKSKMARDSAGRTRTEHSTLIIGPLVPDAGSPTLVTILDPVAGESILLNDAEKTAMVHKLPKLDAAAGNMTAGPNMEWRMEKNVVVHTEVRGAAPAHAVGGVAGAMVAGIPGEPAMLDVERLAVMSGKPGDEGKVEDLGGQTIEGVFAQGTRITQTIPTGQIGNDRPIEVVTERWYSPDLQMVVKTSTRDPQSGETTYRLTNIQLGEPAASLFQIPAGYTRNESPMDTFMYMKKSDAAPAK